MHGLAPRQRNGQIVSRTATGAAKPKTQEIFSRRPVY